MLLLVPRAIVVVIVVVGAVVVVPFFSSSWPRQGLPREVWEKVVRVNHNQTADEKKQLLGQQASCTCIIIFLFLCFRFAPAIDETRSFSSFFVLFF